MPSVSFEQQLVNALQLQRNVALDTIVQLSAQLAVAEDRIKQLEATLDEVNKFNEVPESVVA